MSIEINIGKIIEYKKAFSLEEVEQFAEISGDNNPIHLNEEYAAESIFGKRVVHGVLLTSMFSKIFGTIYPGNGGIYITQNAKFLKPVYHDIEVTARVTLIEFDEVKNRGLFVTECFNNSNEKLVTGDAAIIFPKF